MSEDLFAKLQQLKDRVSEVEKARMKRMVDIDAAEARLETALTELKTVYGVSSIEAAKELLAEKQQQSEELLVELRGAI